MQSRHLVVLNTLRWKCEYDEETGEAKRDCHECNACGRMKNKVAQ